MINIALINDETPAHEEDWIKDPLTGEERPKQVKHQEKPKGVTPSFKSSLFNSDKEDKVKTYLDPKDWFLTQSTIMACLPMEGNKIPAKLHKYVNSNFNTYPSEDLPKYINDFKQALLFKNHDPRLAYGFVLDVKDRPVKVGKFTLNYVDILTAVNKNIDKDFAKLIEDRDIKYMSWGHTPGKQCICGACGTFVDFDSDDDICDCILAMIIRRTPKPAVVGDRAYGIIHRDFDVFDVSYLSEKPAYGGAISNTINLLEKPLAIEVSPELFNQKAKWAVEQAPGYNYKNVVADLFKELQI